MHSKIETIKWFNLFDYPLTTGELHRYARENISDADLSKLKNTNGFWHLPERENIVATRQSRTIYTDRKYKKAAKLASFFAWLPWLKLVAVTNVMGSYNLRDGGDIDLLIICSPNRLWLTRLIMAGSLKILNLRPKPGHEKDKFCLSFFLSSDNLNLDKICLQNQEDIYVLYWLACLVPVWQRNNTYERLIKANQNILNKLVNWQMAIVTRTYLTPNPSPKLEKGETSFNASWGEVLDQLAQDWQLKKLPEDLKNINNLDTRVITNRDIIKLHNNDRRAEFLKKC